MKGLGEGGPPPIGRALILWLEKIYPDRLPRGEVSLQELARLRGQRDLVATLRQWYEAQNPGS